jgi:Flp pilus assembly protein TadG
MSSSLIELRKWCQIMKYRFLHQVRRVFGAGKTWLRDSHGVAAVEFGLLAPLLLLMFVGCVEVGRAVSIDRRVGLVTSLVADMVAREETMSATNLNAIYDIAAHIMSPYDASVLKLTVVPVKASPSNKTITKVYAATTNRPTLHGSTAPAKCSNYTVTADLLSAGESIIVVESSYTFVPLFVNTIVPAATWTDKAVLSPRHSCVDFDGDSCVSTCF